MEIRQDDSDRSNPDVSDGYDFYGKEGPTQPNKFIMVNIILFYIFSTV